MKGTLKQHNIFSLNCGFFHDQKQEIALCDKGTAMSSLRLIIILVFVASLIVLVESQATCSKSTQCGQGECCVSGKCKEIDSLGLCIDCFFDSDCTDGCCVNYKCKSKWSYQCTEKNKCTTNSDCDSDCCKDNQCQESFADCIVLPTVKYSSDECFSSTDCYSFIDGRCCVHGSCQTCTQGKYISKF